MASRLVVLDAAKHEYEEAIYYIAEILKSPHAAASFHEEFVRTVERVVENPELFGISRNPYLAELGFRAFRVKKYLALYRVEGDAVVLAHVFHQTQDYARLV